MARVYDNEGEDGGKGNPGQSHYEKEVEKPGAAPNPDALKDAEESPDDSSADTSDGGSGDALGNDGLYRKETAGDATSPVGGQSPGFRSRAKNALTKKGRRGFIVGGFAVLGILMPIIVFFMLLLMSLKAPHFVANVTEWQFARVTRAIAKSTTNVTNEETAMKTVNDSKYAAMRARYIGMKDNIFRNMERVSSGRIIKNLQGANKLKYDYAPRGGALGKLGLKRLDSITIAGNKVVAPSSLFSATDKYFHPINTAKDRLTFYRNLDEALRVYNPQVNTIVRSQAMKKMITEKVGASLVGILSSKFAGKNRTQAAAEMNKQTYENSKPKVVTPPEAAPKEIKEGTQALAEEADACVADAKPGGCLQQTTTNRDGMVPRGASRVNTIFKSFSGVTAGIIGALNPIYQVAVPLCLIYTGSVFNPDTVNENSKSAEKSAIEYNSIDAQVKKGDRNTIVSNNGTLSDNEPTQDDKERAINAEALGAAGDKLDGPDGDGITKSNAMLRMQGQDPNTLQPGSSTQTTALGGFGRTTIFDTFLPKGVASPLNTVADKMCPAATNLWVGGALALANLITIAASAVGSAGAGAAAEVGGEIALREAVTKAVGIFAKKIVESFTTKSGFISALGKGGSFAKSIGTQVTLITAATYLAKLIVFYNAGSMHNGLAVGLPFANDVDNGSNQLSGRVERQVYGGRAMTYSETAQSNEEDAKARSEYQRTLSPYQRYLAIDNANSLLTRFGYATVMKMNHGTIASLISSIGNIFNPLSLTSKMFGSLSSRSANALTVRTANYNNVQFAHLSKDEEKFVDSHPDFASPSENAYQFEQAGEATNNEIDAKYSPCMELEIGDLLGKKNDDDEPYLVRKDNGDIEPDKGICSPQQLSYDNPKYGSLVLRWRLTKYFYNTAVHNLYGIQNAGVTK